MESEAITDAEVKAILMALPDHPLNKFQWAWEEIKREIASGKQRSLDDVWQKALTYELIQHGADVTKAIMLAEEHCRAGAEEPTVKVW